MAIAFDVASVSSTGTGTPRKGVVWIAHHICSRDGNAQFTIKRIRFLEAYRYRGIKYFLVLNGTFVHIPTGKTC
jgi:hypothetical protein